MSPLPRPGLIRLVLLAQVPGLLAVATLLVFADRNGGKGVVATQAQRPAPAVLVVVHAADETQAPLQLRATPALAMRASASATPRKAIVRLPDRALLASLWRPLAYALLPFVLLLPLMLLLSQRLSRRLQQASLAEVPQQSDIREALLTDAEARQAEIARELHDGVGSSLAGVSLLLGTARSFTREPEASALIATSQEQVGKITQQIRQISRGIMPAGQERGGLLPALEHFALEMGAIRGVRCVVCSRGSFENVSPREGGHLVRIVQEATNNALRHGEARRIRILLAQAGPWRRLTIVDDGKGCDVASALGRASGFGIRSMRARAQEIGAAFCMDSRPGRGTRVQVAWKCVPRADTN